MYEVKGRYFWSNGVRMRHVLLVSTSRFQEFLRVVDSNIEFEELEIVPTNELPYSEALYIGPDGALIRMLIKGDLNGLNRKGK